MRRRGSRGGALCHARKGEVGALAIAADQRVPLAVVERADLRERNAIIAISMIAHGCADRGSRSIAKQMASALRAKPRYITGRLRGPCRSLQ
jgi:hypothetical protein